VSKQYNIVAQKLAVVAKFVTASAAWHRVVERARSVQLPDAPYTDMCESCETWRLRTPNEHASLLHWATIIRWRCHIYDFIVSAFSGFEQRNPALYSLGFKDKSWSVNTLARIARKHGQPALANRTITTMYKYPTMEVSEAFAKIREQCKAFCIAPDMQARRRRPSTPCRMKSAAF
jgi:FAT domain